MSSIDHVSEQETADAPAEQIAVDGSIGSDTDTGGPSKSEAASKDGSDVQYHARSNSVKKPTTFKAVSVTKNFLAKAGTSTVPVAKINGDNGKRLLSNSTCCMLTIQVAIPATGGNTMPPPPRPRLVAKTAGGTKAIAPKSSHSGSKHGGSGPDPMQVWNRNRGNMPLERWNTARRLITSSAAPQPTPKHFTDEELKQQYGIHLATRLQADGDGKEAKWADIDDDEDDWAPETIEWNDGTKITLSQNDSAAILAEEQAAALVAKERQEEEKRAKLVAQQKPTTTVGPNATVLKPRSAAQPKSGGLVLKTPSEKPTLVAKPAAPAPVRSPWASLPPVDKVPPVDINPPSQVSFSLPQHNESHGNSSMPPTPQAAVEIAADDFTRTRRETQNGNLGQLYNAQSGQYEPANATRRGSVRKDQHFRPPSLLQRGSAAQDPLGPAEPSAAFQTHRSGGQQDAVPWTRRGSSTVSGESGPQGRKTSMSKGSELTRIPNDLLQQRRESQHSQPLQSPSTPAFGQTSYSQRDSSPAQQLPLSATQSPSLQNSQIVREGRPNAEYPYQSRNFASDAAAHSKRDEAAVQKKLMAEKRELAIERKKVEEEREKAAKIERIRLKMEKLGMPPLEGKREPEKKTIEKRATELVKAEPKEKEKPDTQLGIPKDPVQLQKPPLSVPRSPPKPPVPDASGTPQQYGMMKLHGVPPTNAPQAGSDGLAIEKMRTQAPAQRISPPDAEYKAEQIQPLSSPIVNGVTTQKQADPLVQRTSDVPHQNMVQEQRQQPWNNASRDQNVYPAWNGQVMAREPSTSNNVWGPPQHARILGNGTFDRNVQRPQSRQQEKFVSPALAPIGPPRHLQRPREAPQARFNDLSQGPVIEDFQTIPTFPPSEAPTPSTNRPDMSSRPPSGEKQVLPPQLAPEAQPRSLTNNVDTSSRVPEQQRSTLATWGNFHVADAEKNRQLAQQHAARLAEEARTGMRHEPQLPIMNETWRQIKVDDHGGQRHIIGVSKGQNIHGQVGGSQTNGNNTGPSFIGPPSIAPAMTAGVGRGSRFFPNAGRGIQSPFQGVTPYTPGYARSLSPPPPDTDIHPAYVGDRHHPLVNLPFMKEKPKVRLPPSPATPVDFSTAGDVRATPLRAVSQPLVNNPSWQDRFNGLLGVKKSSPEKKFAQVAGFSTTKVPLDLPGVQILASVSLPPKTGEAVVRSIEAASRAVEDEEALFENREFGSLPAVLIPSVVPEVGWSPAKYMKRGQYKQSRLSREVDATSKETFIDPESPLGEGILIFINLLGMALPKSMKIPHPNLPNTNHGGPRHRNFSGSSKSSKAFKARESPGSYDHIVKNSLGGSQRHTSQSGPMPQLRQQPNKNYSAWGPRNTNAVH